MLDEIDVESLETLLPDTTDSNSKDVYIKTLGWAMKNDEIKNLAITGSYGSGKSSILKTFWKNYEENEKVLEISAATFSENKEFHSEKENDDQENSTEKINIENMLEQHIMQQMFYRVKPQKIPLSRFTRIQNNTWGTFWDVLITLCSFILILSFVKDDWLGKLNAFISTDTNVPTQIFIVVQVMIFGVIIIVFNIFRLVKILKNFRLNSFGIGSATFEFKGDNNNTFFNKYLDEIIYFFAQTGINTVVFEDLDRFKNLNIFERLRGLNHILNQSEELEGKNIKFVYALRDDIFSKNDNFQEVQNRTKFFDFIIPTVKIMHSSNSESVLLSKLKNYIASEGELINQDGLSRKLITDISLFISDMRVLKNICNEYIIYRAALKQSGIQQDKLFAIIVYKNIYPKDFSDLLNGEGHLNSLLNLKEELFIIQKKEYESKIEELEEVLSNVEKDTVDSLDGLVITYLRKIGYLDMNNSIELANHQYQIKESSQMTNLLKKLLEVSTSKPNLKIINRNYNHLTLNFEEFCTAKGNFPDILLRAKAILIKENNDIPSLQRQILEMKKNIVELRIFSFSEVIKKSNDFSIIDEHLKDKDLLRLLILQGWIGEDYDEYITYFYEGAMFKEDINFLKSVRLNNPLGFDYKLKNRNEVQKKLSNEHFNSSAILNYDLLNFLLCATEEELNQKRRYLLEYISKDLLENFSFISGFLDRSNELLSEEVKVLIVELSEINEDLWMKFQENALTRNQEVSLFLRLFLSNTPSMMNRLNISWSLKVFIEESQEFLSWWSKVELGYEDLEKMKLTLEELEVKFTDLEYVEGSSDIINIIIENNLYEIKESVLSTLLNEDQDINFKIILDHKSNALKSRVEKEIEKFISQILLKKSSYSEKEDIFLMLLNHEDVDRQLKIALLEIWDGKLDDLSKVDDVKLYTNIFSLNKIKLSWKNIEVYYDDFDNVEGTQVLKKFITNPSNFDDLIKDTNNLEDYEIKDGCFEKVVEIVIYSDEINYLKLIELISIIRREITIHSPSEVSESNYEILIQNELLKWEEPIAEYLFEKHPKLAIKYFMTKKDELSNEEIERLINNFFLPWDKDIYNYLNENENHDLSTNYLVSFQENQFLDKLEEIKYDFLLFTRILNNEHAFLETKFNMINNFKRLRINFSSDISNWLLLKLKEEGFEKNINNIDRRVFEELLLKSLVEEEDIAYILLGCINSYSYPKNKIYSILEDLTEPFSLLVIPGKRNIEFKYSDNTKKLLNYLKNKEMIASVSPKDEYLSVNNKSNIRY